MNVMLSPMNLPPYVRIQGDTLFLHVKVVPRSARNEIVEAVGNELKVKIAAPPVDSAANEELIQFLADVLKCPRGAVQVHRGSTSRHKTLSIRGLSPKTVVQMLDPGNHD
jgi:uncharacterized protein